MKIIERFSLTVFSFIMLILSLVMSMLIFGWIDITFVDNLIIKVISNSNYVNITLGVCAVVILLSIKCIFFSGNSKADKGRNDGVLLENDSGKLLISKDTIENLANSVCKDFDSISNVTTKIQIDKDNTLKVFVTLFVRQNVVIKELSANLQAKIKESVKRATDLDINQVNIKVKNISTPKADSTDE